MKKSHIFKEYVLTCAADEETRRAAAQDALDAVNDAVFSGESDDEVERLLIAYTEAEARTLKGRRARRARAPSQRLPSKSQS